MRSPLFWSRMAHVKATRLLSSLPRFLGLSRFLLHETVVPQETKEHCQVTARRLYAISAKFASSRSSLVPDVVENDASDIIKEFYTLVNHYSLSKTRKRTRKIVKEKWIQHRQRCREFLHSGSQQQAYDDLITCMDNQRFAVNRDNVELVVAKSISLGKESTSEAGKEELDYLENFRGYGE